MDKQIKASETILLDYNSFEKGKPCEISPVFFQKNI